MSDSLKETIQLVNTAGGASTEEGFNAAGAVVTTAIVSSEAGDRDLRVFDGELTASEVSQAVYDESPDWWGSPDEVYVDDLLVVRFSQ